MCYILKGGPDAYLHLHHAVLPQPKGMDELEYSDVLSVLLLLRRPRDGPLVPVPLEELPDPVADVAPGEHGVDVDGL